MLSCTVFLQRVSSVCALISGVLWLTGGNRISQQVSGAHEGGIFSVCVLKDGTMVSGGGKDRKVVLWGHDYRKKAEMEVMTCVQQRHHLYLSHGSQEGHQEDRNRNTINTQTKCWFFIISTADLSKPQFWPLKVALSHIMSSFFLDIINTFC